MKMTGKTNDAPQSGTTGFLQSSFLQVLLYAVTGIIFFALCRIQNFATVLGIRPPTVDELDAGTNFITGTFDIPAIGNALAWFLLGCVVYLLIWGMIVVIVDAYNTHVVSSSFKFPTSFRRASFWTSTIGKMLVRTWAAILFVVLAVIMYKVLLPAWYETMTKLGSGLTLFQNIFRPTLLLLLWIVVLHVFTLLLRLIFLRRRVLR